MTRTLSTRLAIAAALALGAVAAAPAQAQHDDGPAPEQYDAEAAYLRAHYLEIGDKDPSAAAAAYDALLKRAPDGPMASKALLGLARCLRELGRHAEADATVEHILAQFPGDAETVAAARALSAGAEMDDTAITNNVVAALRHEDWGPRVRAFGAPAISVLEKALRTADPLLVERAATSLLSLGSDAACDALAEALRDESVTYVPMVTRGIRSRRGVMPARLGNALVELPASELRDGLLVYAAVLREPRPWLVEAFVARADVRELLLSQANAPASVATFVKASLEAGPGPARDRVLTYLHGLDAESSRSIPWEEVGQLTGVALQDDDALSALSRQALWTIQSPSSALRDALLRSDDAACRSVALGWTWDRQQLGLPPRDAFARALVDYEWNVGNASRVGQRILFAFDGAPTDSEWRALIPRGHKEVAWHVVERVADAGNLTTTPLDLLLDAGRPQSALAVLNARGPIDVEWALRRVPPLLRHEDQDVRRIACGALVGWHVAGTVDATAYADEIAAAMPRLARRVRSAGFDLALQALLSMGDRGAQAFADHLDFTNDRADDELVTLHEAGRPEAGAVARRWIEEAPGADVSQKPLREAIEAAATMLAIHRPDEVVDVLSEAWTRWEGDVSRDMVRRAVVSLESPEIAERLLLASLERLGPHGRLPPRVPGLSEEGARRVARAALASEHATVHESGASWEVQLRDPAAVPRLAELAESGATAVRHSALAALAEIRKAEAEIARVRALIDRSKTEARVRGYLASESPRERMAGIAGLVALGVPDALERLLDIAASDTDPEVAAEARRALMALRLGRKSASESE